MSGNVNLCPFRIFLITIYQLDDMENQLSVTLEKHVDPQGEPTIGLSIADDKHTSLNDF